MNAAMARDRPFHHVKIEFIAGTDDCDWLLAT